MIDNKAKKQRKFIGNACSEFRVHGSTDRESEICVLINNGKYVY